MGLFKFPLSSYITYVALLFSRNLSVLCVFNIFNICKTYIDLYFFITGDLVFSFYLDEYWIKLYQFYQCFPRTNIQLFEICFIIYMWCILVQALLLLQNNVNPVVIGLYAVYDFCQVGQSCYFIFRSLLVVLTAYWISTIELCSSYKCRLAYFFYFFHCWM